MPEILNVILEYVSRLLFSLPAFVKMPESSSSSAGARQVQDASGEMSSSHPSVDSSLLSALDSSSLSSFVSDIAESVDEEFRVSGSQDTLLTSTSPPVSGTLQSSKLLPHGSGLGISGLTRKDGSQTFDGLGIVSIKSSPWRHDDLFRSEMLHLGDGISQSEGFDSSLLGTGISDVLLQETLFTFTQDPFHHSLNDDPRSQMN